MSWQITPNRPIFRKQGQQRHCFVVQPHAGSSCFIHETVEHGLLVLNVASKKCLHIFEEVSKGNGICIRKPQNIIVSHLFGGIECL